MIYISLPLRYILVFYVLFVRFCKVIWVLFLIIKIKNNKFFLQLLIKAMVFADHSDWGMKCIRMSTKIKDLKVSFYKISPLFSRFLIYTSVNKWLILYLHLKTSKHCHFSFGALRKCFNDIFHILMMFSLSDRHLFFLPPFISLI